MKQSRFTEERIIAVLREQESGSKTGDVCRKHGIPSEVTEILIHYCADVLQNVLCRFFVDPFLPKHSVEQRPSCNIVSGWALEPVNPDSVSSLTWIALETGVSAFGSHWLYIALRGLIGR